MTPSEFFGTSLRRDPHQPRDLNARIEAQLRERLSAFHERLETHEVDGFFETLA